MDYRNIVICGDVGTGTSTLSKALAKTLGWKRFSGGEFFRKWSRENNVPLWDKMAVPDAIDKAFDDSLIKKLKSESETVFDTHYGGWFARNMKDTFKILLVCPEKIADSRISERTGKEKETLEEIAKRRTSLRKKFKKLYSQDNYEDPKYFDLVVDTEKNSIGETVQSAYQKLTSP